MIHNRLECKLGVPHFCCDVHYLATKLSVKHADTCLTSDGTAVHEELEQHEMGMEFILVFLSFNHCVVRIQYWPLCSNLHSLLPSFRKREDVPQVSCC
jgi:hypothetical protein